MSSAQRKARAEALWKEFRPEYTWLTPGFAAGLFQEAIRCYLARCDTAVCIVCRVAIEDALYSIYRNIRTKERSEVGVCYAIEKDKPGLEDLKRWARRFDVIDEKIHKKISQVQQRGNREAHGVTKKFERGLKRTGILKAVRYGGWSWISPWADENEAFAQLEDTAQVLIHLGKQEAIQPTH